MNLPYQFMRCSRMLSISAGTVRSLVRSGDLTAVKIDPSIGSMKKIFQHLSRRTEPERRNNYVRSVTIAQETTIEPTYKIINLKANNFFETEGYRHHAITPRKAGDRDHRIKRSRKKFSFKSHLGSIRKPGS